MPMRDQCSWRTLTTAPSQQNSKITSRSAEKSKESQYQLTKWLLSLKGKLLTFQIFKTFSLLLCYIGWFSHAFIEFATIEAAQKAKRLTDSLFKGRQITVLPKRKNLPGRGRVIRGGRGGAMMNQFAGMLTMMMRGMRGGRGGRGGFKPYWWDSNHDQCTIKSKAPNFFDQ